MDRAIHRHARLVLAECISAHRLWRAQSDGREESQSSARTSGRMAALARVRRYSLVEFTGGRTTMTHYTYTEGPLGRMLFTANAQALTGVYFIGQKYEAKPRPDWVEEDHIPVFTALRGQLARYFKGELSTFDVPLAPRGTPFQQRVWEALLQIECG